MVQSSPSIAKRPPGQYLSLQGLISSVVPGILKLGDQSRVTLSWMLCIFKGFYIKPSCHIPFSLAFIASRCIFEVPTLVSQNKLSTYKTQSSSTENGFVNWMCKRAFEKTENLPSKEFCKIRIRGVGPLPRKDSEQAEEDDDPVLRKVWQEKFCVITSNKLDHFSLETDKIALA